jgi:FtsP/CotA-like multicopper oxidase with cupredoxin domain
MKSIRRVFGNTGGLSRRGFLWKGGAATAFLAPALAGFAIAQNHGGGETTDMQGHTGRGVPRAPYDKNAALIEPEVRRSANGELRTNLRVGYTYKDIGGYRLSLRSYEGTIPGPTLRVKPGDVLRMRLTNALPPNPDPTPVDMSLPHHFNTTKTSTSTAGTSARTASPTTSFARWSRGRATTSRSRSPRIIPAAPIGTIRTTTAAPTSR